MVKLDFMVQQRWADKAVGDGLDWHDVAGHFQTDRERAAYKAGFAQGWAELRKAMVVQGLLKVTDKKGGTK